MDKALKENENILPDSKYKQQLIESGLIEEKKIKSINPQTAYKSFKTYEKEIDEINIKENNKITAVINISLEREQRILNSFENFKKMNGLKNKEDDWKYENEREIKENIEIKINGKIINFSYFYKFPKEGTYKIQYSFKKNMTKINHLFSDCNSIKNLNFSKFNSRNVTDMSYMFYNCQSLESINLLNFNTRNVNNMSNMFSYCNKLTDLDLSSFDTQNVTNMSYMFIDCLKLKKLDLSHFNTSNLKDMNSMFYGCNSLTDLYLSNFNTKSVTDMNELFHNCDSLKKKRIITKDNKILKEFIN